MLSKLSIGLLALALLFGLSKPANAQGYWGMYGPTYGPPYYHPADTGPNSSPLYLPYSIYSPYYYVPYYYSPYYYSPYYTYLANFTSYYPGYQYAWWTSWRR
jgi:hypothetical protein